MDPRSLDPEAVSLSRQCVKCDAPGILAGADSRKAVYCAPCFVQMVKHKFRSSLGKRRIYKDGASKETLLLFDGSLGSAFALGQLVESLEDTQHRKLMIEPTILFLIVSTNTARINEVLKRYMDISTSLSIPFRIAHVAAALQKNFDLSDVTQSFIGEDQLDRYSQLLSSMRTSTAKNEVKRLLIEVITARFAIASGIEKIWLPSTGDDLARNTIQFFSLGRGKSRQFFSL
ncbi:unnamed protein product, partial [Mesorhabditis belari]|uniref:Cytoplasmic tRNA 2-thiolation protein 2 n=1 Tax=Mesorhabditis belari TaxID=2138241 RepID=A0AAF3F5V9_9BILA